MNKYLLVEMWITFWTDLRYFMLVDSLIYELNCIKEKNNKIFCFLIKSCIIYQLMEIKWKRKF
jgi:hypothetical protein